MKFQVALFSPDGEYQHSVSVGKEALAWKIADTHAGEMLDVQIEEGFRVQSSALWDRSQIVRARVYPLDTHWSEDR